jgi:hypothetical protein
MTTTADLMASRSAAGPSVLALALTLMLGACGSAGGSTMMREAGDAALASGASGGLDYQFYRENVEPIFMRPRGGFTAPEAPCVSCHTFQATTPLKLEVLTEENGRVYWTEEQSRRNYQVVSRLVNPAEPGRSRLLRAPLSTDAGGRSHTGGNFWPSSDHPEYRVIEEWIGTAPAGYVSQVVTPTVDFEFFHYCVQPIVENPIPGAVGCTSCHAGSGERTFANPYPEGQEYWTMEQSRQNYEALMELIDPGFPEYSRFLHHPLAPRAGGDLMHNGGRRWQSKEDPEWQALARWIRGELRGSNCPEPLRFPGSR